MPTFLQPILHLIPAPLPQKVSDYIVGKMRRNSPLFSPESSDVKPLFVRIILDVLRRVSPSDKMGIIYE